MIFVTVGAQMPFDRLVETVDVWAGRSGVTDVFAQIGPSSYRPQHIAWCAFLDPREFRERMQDASVVVAHAGMGTILTALEAGKPLLVMPRDPALRETRNDHQVGTAERFRERGSLTVAADPAELSERLDRLDELRAPGRIASHASAELISTLRAFVEG